MPGCCAFDCTNHSRKGFKMYAIPSGKRDEERRRLWLLHIKRDKHFTKDISRKYLCAAHFESDQFEAKVPGKLKPSAVPTLFSHLPPPKHRKPPKKRGIWSDEAIAAANSLSNTSKDHIYANSKTKPVPLYEEKIDFDTGEPLAVEDLHGQPEIQQEMSHLAPAPNLITGSILSPVSMAATANAPILPVTGILFQMTPLVTTINNPAPSLDDDNREAIRRLKLRVQSLQKKLRKADRVKELLEENIKKFLGSDQISYLANPHGRVIWKEDTIVKAAKLRLACGYRGYNLLLAEGYPLPTDCTIRRRLKVTESEDGCGDGEAGVEPEVNGDTTIICADDIESCKFYESLIDTMNV